MTRGAERRLWLLTRMKKERPEGLVDTRL